MKIEMLLIIVTMIVLNVLGQRMPEFFDKRNYENFQYQEFGQSYPYQGGGYKYKSVPDHQTKKPFKVDMAVYEKLDEQLEKYNKYEEFKEFTDQVKERTRMDPSRTVQDELKEILQWSRNLDRNPTYGRRPQVQNINVAPLRPSPGMSPYWGETEQQRNKNRVFPAPGPNTPRTLTGRQVMNLALRNLANVVAEDNKSRMKNLPKNVSKIQTTNVLHNFPEKDDFNSPIRWVSLNSNDTRDGLAKVTDPRTGKNQQFILNETILVPVIDYNVERLGLTTTTNRPVLTSDKRMLLTVARSIDFKTVDARDWLAFENALGDENVSKECHGDGCQSRCKTLACESVCRGDTCASGCIGGFCNTFCKGPGCLSMCIGESCTAKCEGLSCESRCRGDGCEADCRTFSCSYFINGRYSSGSGSWSDHYPQYDDKNIRNTQY